MCSNIWVKGLYTSDIAYNVQTFPKEVSLKAKSKESWHAEFRWKSIPEVMVAEKPEDAAKSKKKVTFNKDLYPTRGKENTINVDDYIEEEEEKSVP